jgi:class 3 adenylate cyclase/tetratricopeptide (TPR) repeat protein
MSKAGSWPGGHGSPPTSEGGSLLEEAGATDTFLVELLASEPPPLLPVPGDRLGGLDGRRYVILAWMGGGGMGQVFRARDELLHREVALKFLLAGAGIEQEALREARAVARLDHENIVRIFDVTEWASGPGEPRIPFLVMECLEGESLATLLRRGPVDVRRALELLDGITAGLAHAHERHIIHRDLKPRNVFLTWQGVVKLLDFGLSHLAPASLERGPGLDTSGTPAYMAPEQWRGEPQDARTDVWAAGVVLHELLTGRLPCPGTTLAELREWVPSPEPVPPVRARRPEVPQEVETLLAIMLAKDPARRFRTALELREELYELRARLRPRGESLPSLVPQRCQVTLVALQLTGLEGGAPLDAEALGELEAAFHETCAETIEQHGGTMALSMGGDALAWFGCPRAREDDSERAVRVGLQLARTLRDTLQRKLPQLSLSGLSVRAGIHTDQMEVGLCSPESRAGGLVVQGDAPKVAACLAREARAGEVVIGDTVYKRVRTAFETEPLGSRTFEGLSGSVHMNVHRMGREREVGSRFERTRVAGRLSPLVGRERELGRLLDCWERARRGQGAFLLLSGEAGIGKSRLIQELCERVSLELVRLLRVQCWSRASTRVLHPMVELLQEVAHFSPEESPSRRLGTLEARLRELGLSLEDTHLMGLLLSLPVPEDSPVLQLTPEWRKARTFEVLSRLLLHSASRGAPVLLVMEDLHWADSTQLEFLGFLLERTATARLLVLLSARPELQPDWPRRPWSYRLALERLPAGHSAALVKKVARGRVLPEDTVQQLVRKTDGIPLFIEEMTRMVLEGGAVASIPVTLHELLLARLDMLPSRQKALAQLCAVVGRDFSRALLAALTQREEATLGRELAGMVEAELLQEEEGDGGEPGYRFRHVLIQEAAWQSLPRSTRRQHHQHIARVLVEHFPQVGEARPEVLAHHYTEAGETGPALQYWYRAGLLANQRWALQEAMGHLSVALKLLPGLPDERQRIRSELQISSALSIAMAHLYGYGAPELERLSSRSRELFVQMGEELPHTELASWGMLSYACARLDFPWIMNLARRFVAHGERQHDQPMRSAGHRLLATPLFLQGRIREAVVHIEQAVECAPLDGPQHQGHLMPHWTDPKTTALALASVIYSVEGRPEKSRECGREALELAGRIGHVHTSAYALTYTAIACQFRDEAEEALRLADLALALTDESCFWFWHLWGVMVRGWALSELGRGREGLEPMRLEIESCRAQGIRAGLAHGLGLVAGTHLKLGELEEGLEAVREGLMELRSMGERFFEAELLRLQGELLRAQGKHRQARISLMRAIVIAAKQGAGLFELRAMMSLGRLLGDLGQPEDAPAQGLSRREHMAEGLY